jgi:hypothetical protein
MPGKRIIPRERLDLAEELYLTGKSHQRIAKVLCERFGVTSRTARNYIARVQAKIAALPKPPPEAAFQRTEAMLLETYELARSAVKRIAVSQGAGVGAVVEEFPEANVGVMANVAYRLAELHGVAAPQKHELTGKDGGPIETVARVVMLPPLDVSPAATQDPVGSEPGASD